MGTSRTCMQMASHGDRFFDEHDRLCDFRLAAGQPLDFIEMVCCPFSNGIRIEEGICDHKYFQNGPGNGPVGSAVARRDEILMDKAMT